MLLFSFYWLLWVHLFLLFERWTVLHEDRHLSSVVHLEGAGDFKDCYHNAMQK
jgi:hypothetical protein